MFIRIYRPREQKELLLNVDHISKMAVEYVIPGRGGDYWRTTLKEGNENPESVKCYRFWIAGDEYTLLSNPDDPVTGVLENIYNNAIKR